MFECIPPDPGPGARVAGSPRAARGLDADWRRETGSAHFQLLGTFSAPRCDSEVMTAFGHPGTDPGATSEQDDRVLVARVVEADQGALKELYDRHAPWLQARLMRRCNDREVVADVLQDTFVALWKDARTFRGDGEVAGWLWGVAFRRLVSRQIGRAHV